MYERTADMNGKLCAALSDCNKKRLSSEREAFVMVRAVRGSERSFRAFFVERGGNDDGELAEKCGVL